MKLVRLEKIKMTKKLANASAILAANATYGNRSGNPDNAQSSRARAVAMTVAIANAVGGNGSVEVSEFCEATGEANEYHIAHRASRPAEVRVGANVKVTMFVEVTAETDKFIEGYTSTTKGHGRVFVTPA